VTSDTSIERWFIAQGLPHAIHDYSARSDVLTRAAPFLSIVFLLEATASFGDRFTGWKQALVFAAAVSILLAGVALINTLRSRPPLQRPDDIGALEVLLFVFGPAVLPALFGTARTEGFVLIVALNVAVLAVTSFVVSFGLVPMLRVSAQQIVQEVGGLGRLMLRSLPLLLLFATFLFINAEMWQVAHDFTLPLYLIAIGLVMGTAFVFLVLRVPRETGNLSAFTSWSEIAGLATASSAPITGDDRPWLTDPPSVRPLSRLDRINIGVLLFMRQAVQVVLVATVIGAFYVLFGLVTVRERTIIQWTDLTDAESFAESTLWSTSAFDGLALTREHLVVSGFIAAFSALQFAVSLTTNANYRDEFFADAARDVQGVLAVRALYLADIEHRDSA
jgi:hypothetical protein